MNGQASYQVIADMLEVEGVARQPRAGLLFNDRIRKDFESLRDSIKSGGR